MDKKDLIIETLAKRVKEAEKAHLSDLKTVLELIDYIKDNEAQIENDGLSGVSYIEALVIEMLQNMVKGVK